MNHAQSEAHGAMASSGRRNDAQSQTALNLPVSDRSALKASASSINTMPVHISQPCQMPNDPAPQMTDELRKAGISRSTYFRAKRNLKSNGGIRSPSGKQIGRPQKLNAHAEKLIQDELVRNPAAELKQLQFLVLQKCSIQVSLSSISRRLKVLGCSPSQHASQPRQTRKSSEDTNTASTSPDGALSESLIHNPHDIGDCDFEQLPELDNYEDMHQAFGANADLYGSASGIDLDMLEMHPNYDDLGDTLGVTHDDSQLYKYGAYEKAHDIHDYGPVLNPSAYQQAEHQRQMLFNDPNLGVNGEWQEV